MAAVLKIPCLLLEYAHHGTLFDFINRTHESRNLEQLGFGQQQTRLIIKQVASGVLHLHSRCILHRDLKAGRTCTCTMMV